LRGEVDRPQARYARQGRNNKLREHKQKPAVNVAHDPSIFAAPEMAIYSVDKQPFHQIPENLPTFERLPKR
jgi:hypothetical protein